MKRTSNAKLFKQWVRQNNPGAKERLAIAVNISAATIQKIIGGRAPKFDTAIAIAKIIGVSVDSLFPEGERPKKSQRLKPLKEEGEKNESAK